MIRSEHSSSPSCTQLPLTDNLLQDTTTSELIIPHTHTLSSTPLPSFLLFCEFGVWLLIPPTHRFYRHTLEIHFLLFTFIYTHTTEKSEGKFQFEFLSLFPILFIIIIFFSKLKLCPVLLCCCWHTLTHIGMRVSSFGISACASHDASFLWWWAGQSLLTRPEERTTTTTATATLTENRTDRQPRRVPKQSDGAAAASTTADKPFWREMLLCPGKS